MDGPNEVVKGIRPAPSRRRLFAAALAMLVVVSACSGSGAPTVADRDTQGTPPSSQGSGAVDADAAPHGRRMVAWEEAAQQGVAACMAERGFEYVPYVPQELVDNYLAQDEMDAIEVASSGLDDFVLMFPSEPPSDEMMAGLREEAAAIGYGIFIDPISVAADSPGGRTIETAPVNPNAAIIDAMSEEERSEYFLALQGLKEGDLAEEGRSVGGSSDVSCFDVGWEVAGPEPEPPGQLSGVDVDRLFALGDKVYRLAHADPEMTEADAAYAACLAERGVPPDPWQYVADLLYAELERLTGDAHGVLPDTGGGWEADLAAALGEDRLREYQELEREMAVVQIECVGDRSAVERRLLLEYQEEALRAEPDVAAMLGIDLDG